MINISPSPIILEIGIFKVYYYSLLIVGAILVCMIVANKLAKKKNLDLGKLDNLYFYLVIWGIIGARLYEVFFFSWSYYQKNLIAIFKVWEGGLAIQGAILAGIITVFVYCRRNKLSFSKYASLLAVVLPLGQAIGRWGNFFNQELYGRISRWPWAIYIEESGFYHQPLFFYESILNFILFVILYRIYLKGKLENQVFLFYIFGYGLIRFLMEFMRIDHAPLIYGVRLPQILSLIFVIGAGILLTKRLKNDIIKKDNNL